MLAAVEACVGPATQINHSELVSINFRVVYCNWIGLDVCSTAAARFVGLTACLAADADPVGHRASHPLSALAGRRPVR